MRHMIAIAALIFSFLVGATLPAVAEGRGEEAPGPDALFGEWRGQCDAWGAEMLCELDWALGLHPDHFTVSYAIIDAEEEVDVFRGTGVYRPAGYGFEGYWSDSSGAIHPLRASWDGDALITHWGTAGSAQGRTEYRLANDGSLRVIDWALRDDGWVQFMDVTYQLGPN